MSLLAWQRGWECGGSQLGHESGGGDLEGRAPFFEKRQKNQYPLKSLANKWQQASSPWQLRWSRGEIPQRSRSQMCIPHPLFLCTSHSQPTPQRQ